ncbi:MULTISPECIES: NAD-dependent epimerase/dehydratase family protein [Pseudomonas]|uniref:NAD(P)-dependent oxidoreductase n=1 Tax=Pseudomonas quercus TaxID=2722792 RepID=A0ABX0YEE4_9PSED|nr:MULTISPECIES: NAD(P)-dependent oxidoreductase [Pseudomonas]MBF7142752.1 NAD(P)-dependent oxidoreductase [Pseudomonas sp. LY10J]NJP01300.1 NAD(P)-dependent oxidoreductase [Pseudomonas quercus]
MNILVTGASGFIGASFAYYALSQGLAVRATGRRRERLAPLAQSGAEVVEGDLADAAFARRVCQGMDAVVQCAGLGGHWARVADLERANLVVTENIVEACLKEQVQRLVYLSSAQVYERPRTTQPLREDQLPARRRTVQADIRVRAEQRVFGAEEFGLQVLVLRPAPVVGEGEPTFWPGVFGRCAKGRLRILGKGLNTVDFTTQANLNQALLAALYAGEDAVGRVYNIANGAPVPFWDVLNYGLRQLQLPPLRVYAGAGLARFKAGASALACEYWPGRPKPLLLPADIAWMTEDFALDITRARQYLDYQPKASVWAGMDALCQGWRARDTSGKYR